MRKTKKRRKKRTFVPKYDNPRYRRHGVNTKSARLYRFTGTKTCAWSKNNGYVTGKYDEYVEEGQRWPEVSPAHGKRDEHVKEDGQTAGSWRITQENTTSTLRKMGL